MWSSALLFHNQEHQGLKGFTGSGAVKSLLDVADWVASDPSCSLALWMKLLGSGHWQDDAQGEMLPVAVFPRTPAPL